VSAIAQSLAKWEAEHPPKPPTPAEAITHLQSIFALLPNDPYELWQPDALRAWMVLEDTDPDVFAVAREVVRKRCGAVVTGVLDKKLGRDPVARRHAPAIWFDTASVETSAQYLVNGVARMGDFIVIYGPSGCGKTFLTIDFACRIACGLSWRNRAGQSGMCAYVAAEAGPWISPRFVAWREAFLSESVGETPLVIIPRGLNLLDRSDVSSLIEELRTVVEGTGMPLSLLVLDTLSRCMPGGDENGAEAMTHAIGAVDRIRAELGCAVVTVHHSGKDTSRGPRGHSSLFAAADVVIAVADRAATIEKSRDGMTGESFPFSLKVVEVGVDADGGSITSCVVVPAVTAAPTKSIKLTPTESIALDALNEAAAQFGEVRPATSVMPAGKSSVRIDEWRRLFKSRLGEHKDTKGNAARQAFFKAKTNLLAKKAIGVWEDLAWRS
jgi:KaiC/GvpD/RAD55 family RecA-like ATPase